MASLESMSSGIHPHASNTMQSFKVFRDTSQGLNPQLESSEELIRQLEDDLAFATQPNRPSLSPHQSFVCDSPTLPRLGGTDDVLRGSGANSSKGHNKSPANHSPLPLTSPETIILAKNTLKVNLSPRAVSAKRLHEPAQNRSSSRSKRRLLQEDCNDQQYPQKSPKLRYSTSKLNKDLSPNSEDKHGPHTIMEIQESLDSVISSQIAKFQKDTGNSTVTEQPSELPIDAQELNSTATESVKELHEESFATFNGDVTTPRSSAMYNFNSAMRLLNPFKAVGNLLGRLSAAHSPSKPQTLSSEEIARQVDNHLQRFEDKLFDRLAAFQATDKPSNAVTSPMMLDVSSPLLSDTGQGLNNHVVAGLGISPLQRSAIDLSPAMVSSPLAPISRLKNVTLRRTDLQEPKETTRDGLRSPLATALQSPTERLSKGGKPLLEQEQSIAILEAPIEAPRLRNKASQHLKKMASKMNLRNRKSKANDDIPTNNDDYRIMKRKNKDEILRDYLTLQKEKEELEKQLAVQSRLDGQEMINIVAPTAVSASSQIQPETDPTKVTPVLLEATTPNLRVKQKRSNSPDPDDMEQTRTKRRSVSFAHGEMPLSSPLASMNDSVSNTRRSQLEVPQADQIHHEDISGKDQPMVDGKSDPEKVIHVVKKVPPVPAVPSKYRSKVPKPTREAHRARKSEGDWKGWDAEVF